MPPFLAVERARETAMSRLAMKFIVAQFFRAEDHKIINEGAARVFVVRKRDAVFAPPPASYEPVDA